MAPRILGGIEAGGTKFVCVTGTADGTILERTRFPTGDPIQTLGRAREFFAGRVAAGVDLAAIGIAAFGPLELRRDRPGFGTILSTPKRGWSHTDVIAPLSGLGVPVAIDTDVNGAALAERAFGAARGCDQFVYITVGTGIGGGVVIDGRPVAGLVHPEIGHITVPRQEGDDYVGACPFHRDCLEGMASGVAIAARWGVPADQLHGDLLLRAVEVEAGYLAAGIRNLTYALAPQRIVVGGGVAKLPGLLAAVGRRLHGQLAAYPGLPDHAADGFVVPAGCGDDAGVLGALLLAAHAA